MKIALITKDYDDLKNWELRIIQAIVSDPKLELTLVIKLNDVSSKNTKTAQRFQLLRSFVFRIQAWIERTFFFKEKLTVDREYLINELYKTETIEATCNKDGWFDVFTDSDIEMTQSKNIDLIFQFDMTLFKGEILHTAKHGLWSLYHKDDAVEKMPLVGMSEILLKKPLINIKLIKRTAEFDGGIEIDQAFFNRHWSFVKTNTLIYEGAVSMVLKNIKNTPTLSEHQGKITYPNIYHSTIRFSNSLRYTLSFYAKLIEKALERINYKLFSHKHHCWTLFFQQGQFMESSPFDLKPLKLPKHEFWADPFIFKYKDEHYIFFENLDYRNNRGKISCGKVQGGELVDIQDVLVTDYHLSYPCIFEEGGDIYLMPESSQNNRLELYKCLSFPNKWELFSTAFEGEKVADSFFYNDENGNKWLFTNKKRSPNSDIANELYIYQVDSLAMNQLIPHKQNPVIINAGTARNAGYIFEYNDQKIRPSQANIHGLYGRGLNLNKIEKLTLGEYKESLLVTVEPNFYDGLESVHHLCQTDEMFVIDGAYAKLNPASN